MVRIFGGQKIDLNCSLRALRYSAQESNEIRTGYIFRFMRNVNFPTAQEEADAIFERDTDTRHGLIDYAIGHTASVGAVQLVELLDHLRKALPKTDSAVLTDHVIEPVTGQIDVGGDP